MRRCAWFLFFCLAVQAGPARASEPAHAIAMHGAPKYGPGFSHFDYVNPDAPKGGALRLSEIGAYDSLNPFIIQGVTAAGRQLVFESLLARSLDEPFTLYARVAESVEVPEDRAWVIFRIDPRARFHDGTPVTVDDVIFSLETLRDHGRPNHHAYYSQVEKIERVGEHGVKLTFKPGGDRELPLILGLLPVLPKHWFEGRDFETVTLTPIPGSGPYRVGTVDPGRSITYDRDPDYWGRDLPVNRGRYNFDRVRYDYFRDDALAFEAFRAGQVDFRAETSMQRWATGYARRDPHVVLKKLPHGRPSGMLGFVMNTRRPAFKDIRVRQALQHVFDFEWANAKLFFGAYQRTESFFDNSELEAPLVPGADEETLAASVGASDHPALQQPLEPVPHSDGDGFDRQNRREALRLLTEAGYHVKDGHLVDASGAPLSFEILINSSDPARVAQQFARDLERLGVEVTVRLVDDAQYQQRLTDYDFDVIIYFWGQSLSPGNEQAFYWQSQSADRPGTRNYMAVRDPLIDRLVAEIPAARTRAELVTATRLLDRVLRAGAYVIPLYHLDSDRVAYWDRLGMPETVPMMGYSLESWWSVPAP